jgi:hypothetical protein
MLKVWNLWMLSVSLVNLGVMTINQAPQVYVEENAGMRSSMFYDYVLPLLHPKSIAKNFRTNPPAKIAGIQVGFSSYF